MNKGQRTNQMTAVAWDERYRLGVPAMDAEHKGLFELLNHFMELSAAEVELPLLATALDTLLAATRQHFRNEERMLDRIDFPGLAAHRAEHAVLLSQGEHFQERLAAGEITRQLVEQTGSFLHHWLLDHVTTDDRAYVPFLQRLT